MRRNHLSIVTFVVVVGSLAFGFRAAGGAAEPEHLIAGSPIEAGRFLIRYGGCNDCHTVGYAQRDGNVPEKDWLLGNPEGYSGPWGTTFAANLRLTAAGMSEDAWVTMLTTRNARPPMPWTSVHVLTDSDKRALYAYIKTLPVAGSRMPAAIPPKS